MQIINLDLQKKDGFNKAITARRGESGWQFGVRLFDGGLQYATTSGDKFAFKVTTPSGNYARVDCTYANGMVTVPLNSQITSEAGYYRKAYIEITNGSKIRTTQDIIFFSLGNSDISAGQAHYYVSELDKLLKQLNEEFDEWLKEREQDYADLLNRVNQLANRITGLDTKLDDIIAQLQKVEINTKNVFQQSRFSKPESEVRRRLSDNAFEFNGWALGMVDNANTLQMLEPNKTYHTHYVVELMTLNGGELYPVAANGGFALYSGVDNAKYPTVWIGEGVQSDFKDMKVGSKIERSTTFTTPATLRDSAANYRIIGYSRRDTQGVTDRVRIHDMIIQEGSMWTGFQPAAEDTLTKYDEQMYVKSVLVDPNMTGTNPPTVENNSEGNPTTKVAYLASGGIDIQNLNTGGRSRVYWAANKLGLDVPDSKQAFNIRIKARSTRTLEPLEIGYSAGTNNVKFNLSYEWETYTGTIKPDANTALCLYLGANAAVQIKEMYIYPANTDITSNRVNEIEKVTVGTPDILTGADANTLFNSGVWKISGGVNMPPSVAGTYFYLRVINFNVNNCLQVASLRQVTANGVYNPTYIRQCTNGTWQEWRKLTDLFSDGRVDTKAVDFNTLKETETIINTTATNSPDGAASTSWYTQVIRYGSSGNYVYQRATRISSLYQNTYERQLFNGTWTPWRLLYAPYIDQILGTESNANKITTTQNIQLEATTSANLPTSGSGVYYYLETIARADNYVFQRATLRGGAMNTYTRQSHNGVWSAWQLIPQYGGYLPTQNQGQDLSVFTTTGSFMIYAPKGAPMDGTYIWYIEVDAYNATSCKQRATVYGLSDQEWTRQRVNNVWTEWRKVDKNIYLPPVKLTYSTGWRNHNEGTDMTAWNYARAERRGDTVWVYGSVSNTVDYTPSATATAVATLPSGYRPKYPVRGNISRSSGRTMFTLEADTNGNILVGTMVDPGVNGYAGTQTPGNIFHISMSFPAEDL